MSEAGALRPATVSIARVRYADTDTMGVAYYANYLIWFEVGRGDWLRSHGPSYREVERQHGIVLPVIHVRCEYRVPLTYDEEIEVRTTAELLSAVRVRFRYEIVRRADAVVAAAGETVHASTDRTGRPRRLPASVRSLFP